MAIVEMTDVASTIAATSTNDFLRHALMTASSTGTLAPSLTFKGIWVFSIPSTAAVASNQTLVRNVPMSSESSGVLASNQTLLGVWVFPLQSALTVVSSYAVQRDVVMTVSSAGAIVSSQTLTRERAMELLSSLTGSTSYSVLGIYGFTLSSTLDGLSVQGLNIDDLPDLHENGVIWVVNLDTGASSQYEQYGFNSFFTRNGIHYGVAEDGIYKLEGADDAGQAIQSTAVLPKSDFGDPHIKSVPNFYIGVGRGGRMVLKVDADGQAYYYEARSTSEELRTHRFDIGKGLRGVNWQLTLLNADGGDFELSSIEFTPVPSTRRI